MDKGTVVFYYLLYYLNMRKDLIIGVMVSLVLGALLGYNYGIGAFECSQEQEVSEDVQGVQEAANPFNELEEAANPFKDTYKNPFE